MFSSEIFLYGPVRANKVEYLFSKLIIHIENGGKQYWVKLFKLTDMLDIEQSITIFKNQTLLGAEHYGLYLGCADKG